VDAVLDGEILLRNDYGLPLGPGGRPGATERGEVAGSAFSFSVLQRHSRVLLDSQGRRMTRGDSSGNSGEDCKIRGQHAMSLERAKERFLLATRFSVLSEHRGLERTPVALWKLANSTFEQLRCPSRLEGTSDEYEGAKVKSTYTSRHVLCS
jgi:hypothetical protein